MSDQKALRFVLFSAIFISIVFTILSSLKIQYQFYIWEIFLDLKILSLLLILFFLRRKNWYQFSLSNLHLRKWEISRNILWFLSPLLISAVVVGIGLIFRQIFMESFGNAPTLILATLFDVPAIYVFSATTILIEEIFFRALLFDSLRLQKSFWISAGISSAIWGLFSTTEIISLGPAALFESLSLVLYFIATGLLCAALAAKYRSVWIGYSFRIGIISLTSMFLPSLLIETDSFFETKTSMFLAEGFMVSMVMAAIAIILGGAVNKSEGVANAQILQN